MVGTMYLQYIDASLLYSWHSIYMRFHTLTHTRYTPFSKHIILVLLLERVDTL